MKRRTQSRTTVARPIRPREDERREETPGRDHKPCEQPVDPVEPDESDDLDETDLHDSDDSDDDRWDVFILDDDDGFDPLPEYGDFWFPD
jgi:hypothetical protein